MRRDLAIVRVVGMTKKLKLICGPLRQKEIGTNELFAEIKKKDIRSKLEYGNILFT